MPAEGGTPSDSAATYTAVSGISSGASFDRVDHGGLMTINPPSGLSKNRYRLEMLDRTEKRPREEPVLGGEGGGPAGTSPSTR